MAFNRMHMNNPENEYAAKIATEVKGELLDGSFGMFVENGAVQLLRQTRTFMADVENCCSIFQDQLQYLRSNDDAHPCLFLQESDAPVPMNLFGARRAWWMRAWRAEVMPKLFPNANVEVRTVDGRAAVAGFCHHLQRFLTARLVGSEDNDAAPKPRPMLNFQVDCFNPDGRVHYSPAYFFDPDLVFGAPSTPVFGCIDPGVYLFGVQYPGKPVSFDTAKFHIPPLKSATLSV